MVTAYGQNMFPDKYVPTVADYFEGNIEVDGDEVLLSIWDTAG